MVSIGTVLEWIKHFQDKNQATDQSCIKDADFIQKRVIYLHHQHIMTIQLDVDQLKLSWYHELEIEEALKSDSIRVVLREEKWMTLREDDIEEKQKVARNLAFDIVKSVLDDHEVYTNEFIRAQAIKDAVQQFGVTKKTIYKYLRRYWQGGMARNALLPKYFNCGSLIHKTEREIHRKLGRPNQLTKVIGKPVGLIITEEIEQKFAKGAALYYKGGRTKLSFKKAYNRMIARFFNIGYKIEKGIRIPIIPDVGEYPSLNQFRYWYQKQDYKFFLEKRTGRDFFLKHRAIEGISTQGIQAPGAVFQIDATITPVFIVDELEREKITGRAVVYLVIDVFSRMICGVYVGYEGPSRIGAMQALANAFCDKVAFCKRYNVEIQSEDWPCKHVPECIVADRGEMLSGSFNNMVNNLNIQIQNTPPYRGDAKGIVERAFGTTEEKFIHSTPGAVIKEHRQRGDEDYRIKSALTLNELTEIMIEVILHHNNSHQIEFYPSEEDMIGLSPYPIDLWNWGLLNRPMQLRHLSEDIVKVNLLPIANAYVTDRGIQFKQKLFYTCESAQRENWSIKARNQGRWQVKVAYDPRNLKYFYILKERGKGYEKCTLMSKSKAFANKTIEEIERLCMLEDLKRKETQNREIQSETDLESKIKNVGDKAKRETMKARRLVKLTKNQSLKGIRENRAQVKALHRQLESTQFNESINPDIERLQTVEKREVVNYSHSETSRMGLFKKIKSQTRHGSDQDEKK